MAEIEFPFDVEEFFAKYVKNNVLPKNDFEKQAILVRLMQEFDEAVRELSTELDVDTVVIGGGIAEKQRGSIRASHAPRYIGFPNVA